MARNNTKGTQGRFLGSIIAISVSVFFLPCCSSLKKALEKTVVVTVTETKDSIIIRDRVIHDTARVEIPVYVEKNVTKDDSSHLENPYAVSDAVVKDGVLYHSLRTKPQTLDAPIDIHVADTTSTHEVYASRDSTATHAKIVEVEKPLSRWKSFKLGAFWWLLGGLVLSLAWIFRKPILAILKTVLKL